MLAQYVSELRWLGKLAYPDMATVAREDLDKDLFLRGQAFREQTLTPQMEAVQLAERHESGMRDLAQGIQLNRKCGLAPPLLPRHHPRRPTSWPRPPPGNPSTPPILPPQMSFCDILKLMAISTGPPSPPTPLMPAPGGRRNVPPPQFARGFWRGHGESPSPRVVETGPQFFHVHAVSAAS